MNRCAYTTLCILLCVACNSPAPQFPDLQSEIAAIDSAMVAQEEAVKAAVDRFLVAAGNYDLEALPPMFAPNANIGAIRFREGTWQTNTYTFDEFYSLLESRSNPSKYQEPVSHYTVHVEPGGLAFVRADATVIRNGQTSSHNIDYFTLIKEENTWRFLSASYVATPIAEE